MFSYFDNELTVILEQIIFWTEISKEHPIVINTFAELTNKDLPREMTKEVAGYTEQFEEIQVVAKEFLDYIEDMTLDPHSYTSIFQEIRRIIKEFELVDKQWMKLLYKVKVYGQEDLIWQTLIEHIIEEQAYALILLKKFLD